MYFLTIIPIVKSINNLLLNVYLMCDKNKKKKKKKNLMFVTLIFRSFIKTFNLTKGRLIK